MPSRRRFLAGLAAIAAGPGRAAAALDLDRPEVNLEAYVRLRGDTSGQRVYDLVQGRIFGLVTGERPRPLFRTIGAQVSRYERVGPHEYTAWTRYLGLLTDWDTNARLERWINPYTARPCEVPVTRYGPSAMRVLGDRLAPTALAAPAAPGVRPWYRVGDVVHLVDQVVGPAPDAAQPDLDLMTFSGSWTALADPARSSVPSRLAFSAVEHWRDWMAMDRPGSLFWHVTGVKLADAGDYPAELVPALEAEAPGFFDPEAL